MAAANQVAMAAVVTEHISSYCSFAISGIAGFAQLHGEALKSV